MCPGATLTDYHSRRAAARGVSLDELRLSTAATDWWVTAEPAEIAAVIAFLQALMRALPPARSSSPMAVIPRSAPGRESAALRHHWYRSHGDRIAAELRALKDFGIVVAAVGSRCRATAEAFAARHVSKRVGREELPQIGYPRPYTATPHLFHEAHTLLCLQSGKHEPSKSPLRSMLCRPIA